MGLAEELNRKLDDTVAFFEKHPNEDGHWYKANFTDSLDAWFRGHFPKMFGSRTPRGGKELKREGEKILWSLRLRVPMSSNREDGIASLRREIQRFRPHVEEFVKKFSNLAGPKVLPEVTVNGNTYKNFRGFSEKSLMKYVRVLDGILSSLKGWKKKALRGGVVIALAGPDHFHGTAGGVYKSAEDVMYVRATPAVIKRTGASYGSFEYILVHELGHRYEYKVKWGDFDRTEWQTTRYSSKEGEAFAELFALSHFGIKSLRGNDFEKTLERFEDVMSGKSRMAARIAMASLVAERWLEAGNQNARY